MDSGLLVDWINVGVSALAGGAVVFLGVQTNRISKSAAAAAKHANAIELRFSSSEEERRKLEARILLLQCFPEFVVLAQELKRMRDGINRAGWTASFRNFQKYRQKVFEHSKQFTIDLMMQSMPRAHLLDASTAGKFLTLCAGVNTFKQQAAAAANTPNEYRDLPLAFAQYFQDKSRGLAHVAEQLVIHCKAVMEQSDTHVHTFEER